ncbi:MAG: RNA polymerase subunit sigma-70 [Deltaproteobacteria bacterium]|nr:RNA polymerase subunit sigma-70 [Deltaproteobacteria bacterium]
MAPQLEPRFFRHEYGRLVAVLSRRVGMAHLQTVEDAAQHALLAATESWPIRGLPDEPAAWLFRVALNHVTDELRRAARRDRLVRRHFAIAVEESADARFPGEVGDDLLRMLFVCCDEAIPIESQLALALKTLCGFGVREIAERLLTSEANVYKRIERARNRLRELSPAPDALTSEQVAARVPAVQSALYLLFTEGYLSSHHDGAIRRELCDEAQRLARLLAEHPAGAKPQTFALLALMHLHAARMSARQDASGGLLLLEEQDRTQWDVQEIHLGLAWLARAASGEVFSRYHAEAGIAAEHCMAASLAQTRWDRIVACYSLLDRYAPSPLHTLNRAVAVAELHGPAQGLAVLAGLEPPSWLVGSHLWSAVLADLHRRCGHAELARLHRATALACAPSESVRRTLERRLG